MLLTQSEFEERYQQNNLRIALIGMSNIGKSHWARRFKRNFDFKHHEIDDQIQERLSLSSIASSAAWMGHPYDDKYDENAQEYLRLEGELTAEAARSPGNVILDTTGSVIYVDPDILDQLQNNYLVFYLSARKSDMENLISRFKTSPKPLIWGDHYRQISGKSKEESLMELYPSLLQKRMGLYQALSDIEIQAKRIDKKTDLLQLIKDQLPAS